MRPRRQSGASARPFNFTVRGRNQIRLCNGSDKGEEPRQRPFFFFNETATTEIYTLSLHDALPIAFVADAAAVKAEVSLSPRAGFALRKPRAHSRLCEGVL